MMGRRTKPKAQADTQMPDESDSSRENGVKNEDAAEPKQAARVSSQAASINEEPPPSSTGDEADYDQEVTRCVCGNQELDPALAQRRGVNSSLFIQCEECQAWQHGYCVGFSTVRDVPELYFCEQCRPEFHDVGDGYSRYFGISRRRKRPEDTSHEGRDKRAKPDVKEEELATKKRNGRAGQVKEEPELEEEEPGSAGTLDSAAGSTASKPSNEKGGKKTESSRSRRVTAASREDAILRRVLEQSAQEARAMAAKAAAAEKRAQERQAAEQADAEQAEAAASQADAEAADDADAEAEAETAPETVPETRRRSSREPRPAEKHEPDHDDKPERAGEHSGPTITDSDSNDAANTGRSRGGKARRDTAPPASTTPTRKAGKRADARKPRRGGAAGGRTQQRAAGGAGSYAGSNGLRRCKPRIPAPRTSLPEMRKRVSAILEFSGHTQGEMLNEEHSRGKMLSSQLLKESSGTAVAQLESLCSQHAQSLGMLEELTRKLLSWQEQYG